MNKIKINDEIIIVSGKNKGKIGKVTKVFSERSLVLVEGLNIYKRAMKPSQDNPAGGYVEKELPMPLCKIALYSAKTKSPSRVGFKIVDGKNIRFLKKCGTLVK